MPHRVLYVEDNAINAALMEVLFEAVADLELEVAADGKSALEAMSRRAPDLLLIDGQLPDISGYALLPLLRAEGGSRHCPAVLVSASCDDLDFDSAKAKEAGFEECWSKPIDPRAVIARTTALLLAGSR